MALEVLLAAAADEHHLRVAAREPAQVPVEPEPLGAAEVLGVGLVLQVVHDHDRVAVPAEEGEEQEVVPGNSETPTVPTARRATGGRCRAGSRARSG